MPFFINIHKNFKMVTHNLDRSFSDRSGHRNIIGKGLTAGLSDTGIDCRRIGTASTGIRIISDGFFGTLHQKEHFIGERSSINSEFRFYHES
ncbi:MAG: hypothetical protein ABI876_04630 [Bacteroidota bacterium]